MKSKYKYVYKSKFSGKYYWEGQVSRKSKLFPFTDDGERSAAKWADMRLINDGREPVNVLKKLTS